MKFLIDNNLSFKLTFAFPESKHVRDAVGISAIDLEIWNYALKNTFVILTKDNDFDELSQINGCPPKVLHLSIGNKSTKFVSDLLRANEHAISSFVTDNDNCLMKLFAD